MSRWCKIAVIIVSVVKVLLVRGMQQVFAFGAFIPCLVKWKQRIEKLQQYCASNAIPAQFIHVDTLEQAKALPASMPVFMLQGGFDITRLRGVYRLMMTIMAKTAGKALANKIDRTPDEDAMLELLLHGGSRVSEENLAAVMAWYQKTL